MNTKSKRAVITGVYGQDGSYLAELLLGKGYTVLGIARESERDSEIGKILSTHEQFEVAFIEIQNTDAFMDTLRSFAPSEVYNFAAISDLKTAEEYPELTYDVNYRAFHDFAEETFAYDPSIRIFQALSSRILLPDASGVITEHSLLKEPANMYDKAKRDSYELAVVPLRKRGHFISTGYLCNHESPRRGERFVTGKIAKTAARIARGEETHLTIGNVDALRDWSHAEDIVSAAHAILTHDVCGDYVIGSGELHSVREFITEAFQVVGIVLTWSGEGKETIAHDQGGVLRVQIEPNFYRPDDNPVVSNTTKLERDTGWERTYMFKDLVKSMIEAERTATCR